MLWQIDLVSRWKLTHCKCTIQIGFDESQVSYTRTSPEYSGTRFYPIALLQSKSSVAFRWQVIDVPK